MVDDKYFVDYFPWEAFGDVSAKSFIEDLKVKRDLAEFIKRDLELEKNKQSIIHRSFKNHGKEEDVIKIKFLNDFDLLLKNLNENKEKIIRIDFNSALSINDILKFWSMAQGKFNIEYIEDPCPNDDGQWEKLHSLNIPIACDREIDHEQRCPFKIVKPNRDEIVKSINIQIFSSYMGHELGRYHSYLSLLKYGDLNLYHGIVTPNLYEDDLEIFIKKDGKYMVDNKRLEHMYESFRELEWKIL